jgi:transposase
MAPHPPIPEPLWNTVPPEAQAALLEAFGSLERRIAELEKAIAELQARTGGRGVPARRDSTPRGDG